MSTVVWDWYHSIVLICGREKHQQTSFCKQIVYSLQIHQLCIWKLIISIACVPYCKLSFKSHFLRNFRIFWYFVKNDLWKINLDFLWFEVQKKHVFPRMSFFVAKITTFDVWHIFLWRFWDAFVNIDVTSVGWMHFCRIFFEKSLS